MSRRLGSESMVNRVVAGMSEKDFQVAVVKLARFNGFSLVYHTHDSRRSAPGFPDLVLVDPVGGRVLWRELKTVSGRVSVDQQVWLDGLVAAGMNAGVWRPGGLFDGSIRRELAGFAV